MFRPMLAVNADVSRLVYPLLASYKIDGVRAIVSGGRLLSRTLKPIPNIYLQELYAKPEYEGYDGEFAMIGLDPTMINPDCYRDTVSAVMTEEFEPLGVDWYVFDNMTSYQLPFISRYRTVDMPTKLKQVVINNEEELYSYEDEAIAFGYEGLILRDPDAPYKFGRSTLRQGWMLKLKRFKDSEAKVIDFEELHHNANPPELDERGYIKHSHHQANKVPMNTLGALVVMWEGQLLRIGTGFTQTERADIWQHQPRYKGKLAKFKYLPVGMKDLPRHPVFLGWRSSLDVGG